MTSCEFCGRHDCPALEPIEGHRQDLRFQASLVCAINRIARALEARLPADPDA